jgi:lipoate---protein ligase
MQRSGTQLVRRHSGGGSVYHDLGNSNYSFIMPREEFDRYVAVNMVCRSLHQLDIPAVVNSRHDITLHGFKISGSAYKMNNRYCYHHGTMLIDADIKRLGQMTNPVAKELKGAGVDSVRSEVTLLRDYSYTVDHHSFCEAVSDEFKKLHASEDVVEITQEFVDGNENIRKLRSDIMTDEWKFCQTPPFTHTLRKDDGAVTFHVKAGIIEAVDTQGFKETSKEVKALLTGLVC